MKLKKLLCLFTVVLLLTGLMPAGVIAADKKEVKPMAQVGGSLRFSPNPTTVNNWVTCYAELVYNAVLGWSYETFSLLMDGRLNDPNVIRSTFEYSKTYESYNSSLGRAAWKIQGSFSVWGSATHNIDCVTKGSTASNYPAKLGGGPGYRPDPYPYSATLQVN